MFQRVIGIAVLVIGGWYAMSAHEARAECSPAQILTLQQQNLTNTRIREICATLSDADVQPARDAPRAAQRGPRTSDRCYTPAINCILSENQRVDSSCWCVTPFGPSYGRVK